MSIEIVHENAPLSCRGIARDQTLEVSKAVCFIAGGSERRLNDVPGDDIKVEEARERAMPSILEFTPEHMTRHHRQVRVQSLQCLDSCQLVHADRPFSPFGRLGCCCVEFTAVIDFLLTLGIGNWREEVTEPMRLEAPFLSKRAACRREM